MEIPDDVYLEVRSALIERALGGKLSHDRALEVLSVFDVGDPVEPDSDAGEEPDDDELSPVSLAVGYLLLAGGSRWRFRRWLALAEAWMDVARLSSTPDVEEATAMGLGPVVSDLGGESEEFADTFRALIARRNIGFQS